MTLTQAILDHVLHHPGDTATQVSKALKFGSSGSVSSIMKRLSDTGILKRVGKKGPRGGFGYYIVTRKSWHSRLDEDLS